MDTYNTGRVQIGLLYQRPMPQINDDALTLQTALIDERTTTKPGVFARVLGFVWAWL